MFYFLQFKRSTVYLWLRRFENEGNVLEKKKSGRPKLTTQQQDDELLREVRGNGFTPTQALALKHNVSTSTIRRRLHKAGLHHRVPARKPKLTPRHRMERLLFAERYLNYDFSKVIFSDEKTFKSSEQGRMSLWRINKTRYDDQNVIENRGSGRIAVGIWGWMCASGPGELVEIGGRLNSEGYKDILDNTLLPTAQIFFPEERPIQFVHDNCPIHKSRICKLWFQENHDNIVELPFPAKSPDLNPIENLWGLMVQTWDPTTPRNKNNIIAHVHEIWEGFRGRQTCENMVASMHERLEAVIEANGGHTRF